MKAKIKELDTKEEDIVELSMNVPAATLVLSDDFGETLFETSLTKDDIEGSKWCANEFQKIQDRARNCKTIWDILALYGVTDCK